MRGLKMLLLVLLLPGGIILGAVAWLYRKWKEIKSSNRRVR